tara:strand:+ start:74 stop:343 length:270 start_codon:yes stop_codon:yes gene_type:complete
MVDVVLGMVLVWDFRLRDQAHVLHARAFPGGVGIYAALSRCQSLIEPGRGVFVVLVGRPALGGLRVLVDAIHPSFVLGIKLLLRGGAAF